MKLWSGIAITIALVASLAVGLCGCSKDPAEKYEEISLSRFLTSEPGRYRIANPTVLVQDYDVMLFHQGDDLCIAEGDSLQAKLDNISTDFNLLGARVSEPYVHLVVHAIEYGDPPQHLLLSNNYSHELPAFGPVDEEKLADYEFVQINELDYDKKTQFEEIMKGKGGSKGTHLVSEISLEGQGAAQVYILEGENARLELFPVPPNLDFWLRALMAMDLPFNGYGQMTTTRGWEDGRKETKVIGDYAVHYLMLGGGMIESI